MEKKYNKNTRERAGKMNKKRITEIELQNDAVTMLKRDYGYPVERIGIEVSTSFTDENGNKSRSKGVYDIVAFSESNIEEIIVEVKSPLNNIYSEKHIANIEQILLKSKAKYAILFYGKERFYFRKISESQIIEVQDIPNVNGEFSSLKKQNKKIDDNFFRLLNVIKRFKLPSDFPIYITWIIFIKYIDEIDFNNQILNQISRDNFIEKLKILNDKGIEKYGIKILELERQDHSFNDFLFEIFSELNNYKVTKSNSEFIIQNLYIIFQYSSGRNLYDTSSVSDSISEIAYRFIFMNTDLNKIKEKKLLFTHVNEGKIIFEILQNISDQFGIIGKDLREYANQNILISEKNSISASILKFLLILKGYESTQIFNQEVISSDFDYGFDGIFGFPPIGFRVSNKDEFNEFGNEYINNYIVKISRNLNPSGCFAVLVTGGFLFSKNSEITRDAILEKNILRGIIQLPPRVLSHTSIPPIILLLQRKPENYLNENYSVFIANIPKSALIRKNKISPKVIDDVWEKFLQLENKNENFKVDEITNTVKINTLIKEKNWSPSMYDREIIDIKNNVGKRFSEYVDIITTLSRKSFPNEESVEIPEVRISEITENGFLKDKLEKKVNVAKSFLISKYILQKDDIILSIRGTIGKFGIVDKVDSEMITNSNLVILRPKVEFSKILHLVSSEYFQSQLKHKIVHSFIPYIKIVDIQSIFIPDFLLDEENMNKSKELQTEIQELKKILDAKQRELDEINKQNREKYDKMMWDAYRS